jgi:hypothetical protein
MWKNDRFFESKKKELTKTIALSLLKDGKAKVNGLYSEKSGKTYDATTMLADTGEKYVNNRFEPRANERSDSKMAVTPIELTAENTKDKLKVITDKLEPGIKRIFDSEQYKTYLNTLSKFHNYSSNNFVSSSPYRSLTLRTS